MNLRESLFRALDSLTESHGNGASVSIIHNGRKFKNVKRFDSDKTANDFMEKNKGHGVLHADQGGVYVAHNKNKGVAHTYTPHNEETEHLDEISRDLATRSAQGFADKADNTKLPIDKRKQASSAMQLAVKKATGHGGAKVNAVARRVEEVELFDEEADLTKIDTKRLQSMVQMHKHYGQKNPASKAAADRGEAELKSRMNKESVELDEAKLSPEKQERLDSLISNVMMTTDPSYYGNDTPQKYLKAIEKEFGATIAKQVDDGSYKTHWGRDNQAHGHDKLASRQWSSEFKGGPRVTAAGKMNKQDVSALKNRIKGDKKFGGLSKSVKLPEEVDLDEAVNEKQIRKDLDSGMSHDVVIGKHANKGTTNTDAIRKVIKQHAWDKRMKKESVEGLAEGRPSQAHPLAGHDYHKKSNDQLEYIRKDAHSAAEAMKDHNTTAENKYRDQASDASSVLHFRKTSGTPDWYKKKYGHMKESVDLDENVTNISDAKLKFHVLNGVPHGSYSKAEMKSEHDRRKKTRGPEYNSVKPSLNEAKTDVYHQHMLKALGKTKLPKDHPYTSAVANNGDFVVHNNGKVVGRLPKGEHSIKEESSLPPHLAKLIDPKTGNMKDPEKQKIYDDMMKRRQGMAKAKAKMAEETSSVAKDATVKSTKPNVTANTNTTTPYDVKPQRIKSAEFNKLHN